MGTVADLLQTPESRQYLAPMMSWVSANRAYLSGAAVPEVEFTRDLKTYFPTPNEDPATVALKKAMREQRKKTLADSVGLPPEERKRSLRRSANKDYRKIMESKRKANTKGKAAPKKRRSQMTFEEWKAAGKPKS